MGAHPGQARLGEWLRQQRVAAGLTQEDLAERSGVSVRAIADLERGRTRRPYPSSVRALVRALGLPDTAGTDLIARYRAVGGAAAGRADHGPAQETGPGAGVTVPRQLPTRVPHFAGRAGELALLDGVLDAAASDRAAGATGVVISAIGGTAGVGKTALALHWAHRVAQRFPDGQLYANLRGFDAADGRPADTCDVLRGFLDALGVHPERLPADVEGLAALYRSVVAGRRMLVLLDNAADVGQVRPLLPASPESVVIITSRRELAALAAHEGARLLQLDVLSEQEANELLVARLGQDRAAEEPWAVTELATLCARLPLALSVVVARAAAAPRAPLSSLAAELTELGGRLDALDVGDAAASVRTVLSLSYRHLREPSARLFRLLGLHPGPDISAAAAASLAGVPLAQARAALRDLTRASLLMEVAPGRYAFHDLLRAYAAEQPTGAEGVANTTRRMLDHYLHTAHRAHRVLYPGRELIGLEALASGALPETFGGKAAALAWLEAEYQVLLKVTDLASRSGLDEHAWRLPVVLWTFHNVCGHWHDGARLHRLALEAARRDGDVAGEAFALRGLGSFAMSFGDITRGLPVPDRGTVRVHRARGQPGARADRRDLLAGAGVPGTARGGSRRHQRGAAAVGERAERPEHAARAGERAQRLGLEQRAARRPVAGQGLLRAGHRAVPGDRVLTGRGRHLGHARRGAAAARVARRGGVLLPARRHPRQGDGQPLRPRDGARAPGRDVCVHRRPARRQGVMGRVAAHPAGAAPPVGVPGPVTAR